MSGVMVGIGLIAVALAVSRLRNLQIEKDVSVAVGRALVQLTLVALLIGAVFDNLGLSGLFVVLMFSAATLTAGRRLKGVPGRYGTAAGAVAAGSTLAVVPLFLFGGYGLEPRFLIPIAGIVIGGAMTATSLAGTRARDELTSKTLEVESRLALGVPAMFALTPYLNASIRTSLIPVIDQTKNVGVITLPGAFVGMILGGATPTEAAVVQLTVLFSLIGAETVSGTVIGLLVGRAFLGTGERIVVPDAVGTVTQ